MEQGANKPMETTKCLNPYYNGRYSWSSGNQKVYYKVVVLILIIMEDTHGVN